MPKYSVVASYILGIAFILILIGFVYLPSKEGLANKAMRFNCQCSADVDLGSGESEPVMPSTSILTNGLADLMPLASSQEISPQEFSDIPDDITKLCPEGCTKPVEATESCAKVKVGENLKYVCPYICTGDYTSGCRGRDDVCEGCGKFILGPAPTSAVLPKLKPAPKVAPEPALTTLVPAPPPPTPKNKFYGTVVQFTVTPKSHPKGPPCNISKCPSGFRRSSNSETCQGRPCCCLASWSDSCGESCARAKCDKAGLEWINLDFGRHPYTCAAKKSKSKPNTNKCSGMHVWEPSATYLADNTVVHEGHAWKAKWWTKGEEPGTTGEWGVWEEREACDTGSPASNGPQFETYYVTDKGVLRKTGKACIQRPIAIDASLPDFLTANKFTLGEPMADSETCTKKY